MRYIALLFLIACSPLFADSPSLPTAKVFVSHAGTDIFKIVPESLPRKNKPARPAFGVAYQIDEAGAFREIWRTSGWHAFSVFIADGGRYLIRMGDWAGGREPSKESLAVAFYDKGNLLAKYSTADLVKDKTKVIATSSHHFWLAHEGAAYGDSPTWRPDLMPSLDRDGVFHIKTIDGVEYAFDVTTGKNIKK